MRRRHQLASPLALLLALLVAPLGAAFAGGCDTTAVSPSGERTVASMLKISALHFDITGSTLTVGDSTGYGGPRLAAGLCRFPGWTLAIQGKSSAGRRTGYTIPSGFAPLLYVSEQGLELQRTWNGNATFHAIATVGAGTLSSQYRWVHTENGHSSAQSAGRATATYASVAAGGELNLLHWLRINTQVGRRFAGDLSSPRSEPGLARGAFVTTTFAMGKF